MNFKHWILNLYYKRLAHYAHNYLNKRKPFVIGINGSVGKTSARMIITEVLQLHLGDQLSIYTSPKNFNGELGMPLSIFKIETRNPGIRGMLSAIKTMRQLLKADHKPYDILILEYGTDHPGEMDFLLSIVKPQLSIVTKFDAVHALQYGSEQAIAHEELKLQQATTLYNYINTDDQYALSLSKHLKTKTFFYSTKGTSLREKADHDNPLPLDISVSNYTIKKSNTTIQASSTLHFSKQELTITTNLLGEINHNYIALSYDILEVLRKQFNLPQLTLNTDLTLQLQPGRFSIFEGIHNSILIDSSYNASPASMRAIIAESLALQQNLFPDSRRLLILGEMRELGDHTQSEHESLADWLLDEVLQDGDNIILLGESMYHSYKLLEHTNFDTRHYQSFQEVSAKAQQLLSLRHQHKQTAFVILKGSQNTIFLEEVVKSLLADKSDIQYLTRQSGFWRHKKGIQ